MQIFCGDALCKKPLAGTPSREGPWPVRCPSCSAPLYPEDILAKTPSRLVEPNRALLMTQKGSGRVALNASDLAPGPADTAPSVEERVDRLLDMVAVPGASPANPSNRTVVYVIVAVAVVGLLIAAALFLR